MGLAASQARFLCITARKADCEYKSTDLAQQKLELSSQLSDISTEYANSLNATTLMWSNDAVDQDYGVSYSLLMTPSAANDYNPYMITTPAGAVVLNSEYAAAAKAAGISKGGGSGSQAQRDKFISALVPGGIVTENTAKAITIYDYTAVKGADNTISFSNSSVSPSTGIDWNPSSGLGKTPLNKTGGSTLTLSEMISSESIGQRSIDWSKMFVTSGQETKVENAEEQARLKNLLSSVKTTDVSKDVVKELKNDLKNYTNNNANSVGTYAYEQTVAEKQQLIDNATAIMNGLTNQGYITDSSGNYVKDSSGANITVSSVITDIKTFLNNEIKAEQSKAKSAVDALAQYINVSVSDLRSDKNGGKTYSIVENGIINNYQSELEDMTISDLLTSDIVLMANSNVGSTANFVEKVKTLFDSIVKVFGYSPDEDLTGTGLNVDDASAVALKFAYEMVTTSYLKTSDYVSGTKNSAQSMIDNSAYTGASENNKIGLSNIKDSGKTAEYYAIDLSNMLSCFLTYYENGLSGVNSSYAVGSSVETSVYVTDDSGYEYVVQADEDAVIAADERSADFFDELYNNILEHGWREDASIDDSEYLEAAIKDGRYSMSSLNNDGYYYQTRYNETGYMVEVSDTDAIARAEAEFTAKKAEITYKEDSIDLKTKQLDAEISTLNTEYETVKSLISKNVEKIFSMFSN
jgi:hypothetical protein